MTSPWPPAVLEANEAAARQANVGSELAAPVVQDR